MSKANTARPSRPEWMKNTAKLRAEAKRQGVPGFLLRLVGGQNLRRLGATGTPVYRRD